MTSGQDSVLSLLGPDSIPKQETEIPLRTHMPCDMAKNSLEFKIIHVKNSKLENEKVLKIVMKIEVLN